MHEDRHVEFSEAKRVSDGPLLAEVRQRHEHAVDRITVRPEEIGALLRVFVADNGAEFRGRGIECDRFDPLLLQDCEDFLAAGLAEMGGEESPVPYDDSEGGGLFHDNSPESDWTAAGLPP